MSDVVSEKGHANSYRDVCTVHSVTGQKSDIKDARSLSTTALKYTRTLGLSAMYEENVFAQSSTHPHNAHLNSMQLTLKSPCRQSG